MAGHVIPSTDNLVHYQRDGSQKPDLSALEDVGFNNFERLILATRIGRGCSCLYACICIESVFEDTQEVIQISYGETACHHALTWLCRVLCSAVDKDCPQQRAQILETTYRKTQPGWISSRMGPCLPTPISLGKAHGGY